MGINSISIDYDAINKNNTFSNGDYISGRVTVDASSQTRIRSLTIKAKGKAEVLWSEYCHYADRSVVYYDDEKYFSQEQYLLKEGHSPHDSLDLGPGRHVYPFTFQIPIKDMPSSFKGSHGEIRYKLKAKLSRSMGLPKKAKTTFTFVSKPIMADPGLMSPQHGSKDKDVHFFGSGNISMKIFTDRTGYHQGEEVAVGAEIVNSSTHKVVPKFYIYQKVSFFARGRRRVSTNDILKEKWPQPIGSSRSETVTQKLVVPQELLPSILNCRIVRVEYRIKAVLDIPMSRDPHIKLPLVVLPREDCWSKDTAAKPEKMPWPEENSYYYS